MFYLQKEGVYKHGIFGFFKTFKDAKKGADFAASNDSDDYHDWVIYETIDFSYDTDFSYYLDYELNALYTGKRT